MTMPGEAIPFSPELGPETEFGLVLMAARERLHDAVTRQVKGRGVGFVIVRNYLEAGEPTAEYVLSEREHDLTRPGDNGEQIAVALPIAGMDLQNPQPGLERSQEFFVVGPPDDLEKRAIVNRETYGPLFLGRKPFIRDIKGKLQKNGGYKVVPIRLFE